MQMVDKGEKEEEGSDDTMTDCTQR